MKSQSLFLLLIVLSTFTSCGKIDDEHNPFVQKLIYEVDPAKSENYSYEFTSSSCTTGVQASSTFVGICSKLKNNSANEGCAERKRENLFISEQCAGSFE